MKIGILTFHKARNYGAFMQCYSLVKELKKRFPNHEIEVVNFSSFNLLHYYEKNLWEKILGSKTDITKPSFTLVIKRLIKTVFSLKELNIDRIIKEQQRTNFENVQKLLPLSEVALISDDPKEFEQFVQEQRYDVIIVGSDAIWNDAQTCWPNMYLLHDIKNTIKFSYAASIYGMDYSTKSKEQLEYVNESLKEFDFIGVRDNITEKYVECCSNNILRSVHTCDPSIFLDLKQLPIDIDILKRKLLSYGVTFEKPVIGLMCEEWLAKKVRRRLGESYQYVSVYYRTGSEDVFLGELTPIEWARVFSFFDVTFTHFFHGTLFSLKNGTLTFSIERGSAYKKKYETKIKDVLTRLELVNECYYEDDDMNDSDWGKIEKKVKSNNKIETYGKYFSRLEKESKSKEAFFSALEGVVN